MSIAMSIREFEELNLFSNRNIEKIVSSVVNESSNAALVSMFEDKVILLDHNEGQFYSADFKFDAEKFRVSFDNFENIDLVKEESNFKKKVENFFESEDFSSSYLVESYKSGMIDQEKVIADIINEAISVKDFSDFVDYSELAEANDELNIKDKSWYKKYAERLETHPLTEAKYFNWETPVVVSLSETEKRKIVNSTMLEKAHDLWKKDSFKKLFSEAASTFVDDVEEGKEKIKDLVESFPQLFLLDKADRKTLFGKSIISNSELREHLSDLQKGLEIIFEDEEITSLNSYLKEESEDDEDDDDEEDEDDDDEKDEEEPKELDPEEISDIADELKKISDKVEDEDLKSKLEKVISKLTESIDEGTRPSLVKEAIQLLTI